MAAIVLALVAAYGNSLGAPFVFDDEPAVAAAAKLAGGLNRSGPLQPEADAGETTSGRPLLTLSLAVNHAISGEQGWSYHVANLLIHMLAALTLFGVVRRTLVLPAWRARLGGSPLAIATATAGLWGLHPLQTQAVTYIAQRAESLMGLLYLLTLYGFIRSLDAQRPARWRTLSMAACLLGMATKEVMASAPLIVLLYDRTFVTGSFRAAWTHRRGYYLGLGGTWLPLAMLVISTEGRGGTAGWDTLVTPWHYFLTQCQAVTHYLRLAVWPHPLVFDYGTSVIRNASAVIGPAALLAAVIGMTAREVRRGSAWGFLGCFFFGVLAPSSSFIPIASQTIAEHRMYLALAAPIALAVVSLHAGLGRRGALVCAALVLAGGWLTVQRNRDYRSALTLWTDTVAKRPDNARAHHNLGLAEFNRARYDAALAHFEAALRLQPASADTQFNLGLCLMRLGRPADAVPHYERALELQPHHADAHNNLGNALLALGRTGNARTHYERAIQLKPASAEAHSNLGDTLLRLGESEAALRHSREAIRLNPGLAEACSNAGNALAEMRRFTEARAMYEAALQRRSDDARVHNNLANVLVELGQLTDAIGQYERALALQPDFADPRRNLALLLLHLRRPSEAEPHLEVLGRMLPNDAEISRWRREVKAAMRP